MDWEKARFEKFVMKIAYLGTNYHGLTWQDDSLPTVELQIVNALTRTCLIKDRTSCDFSRCGRTDKGVHAFGNYISLNMRVKPDGTHFDYSKMLNRLLPRDIRILYVKVVPEDFDARFSCKHRTYKYFFTILEGMDVDSMKNAAKLLVGTHDFRNFCRMDVNQTTNYIRTITSITFTKDPELPIYEVYITGTSFLWHQVRCIMNCLLLIGEGVETETLIESLLDVVSYPRKPIYELADAAGLVLFECDFGFAEVDKVEDCREGLEALRAMLTDSYRDTAVMKCMANNTGSVLKYPRRIKYTPILKRATAPSLEEKIASVSAAKRRRIDNSPLEDLE